MQNVVRLFLPWYKLHMGGICCSRPWIYQWALTELYRCAGFPCQCTSTFSNHHRCWFTRRGLITNKTLCDHRTFFHFITVILNELKLREGSSICRCWHDRVLTGFLFNWLSLPSLSRLITGLLITRDNHSCSQFHLWSSSANNFTTVPLHK